MNGRIRTELMSSLSDENVAEYRRSLMRRRSFGTMAEDRRGMGCQGPDASHPNTIHSRGRYENTK